MQLGKVTRALDDIHGVLRAVPPTDRLTAVHAFMMHLCFRKPLCTKARKTEQSSVVASQETSSSWSVSV